jgi:hypothetical protein
VSLRRLYSFADIPVRAAARCEYQPRDCPVACNALVLRMSPDRVLVLRCNPWEPLSIAAAAHPSLHWAASWGEGARFDLLVEDLTEDEIAFVRAADHQSVECRFPPNYTLGLLARLHAARAELDEVQRLIADIRRPLGLGVQS